MRFSAIATLIVSVSSVVLVQARPGPSRLDSDSGLYARGGDQCDIKKCAIDLAPTVASCGIAAAQAEIDVISDAACIAAAVELGTNFPAVCKGCPKKYNIKVPSISIPHIHL